MKKFLLTWLLCNNFSSILASSTPQNGGIYLDFAASYHIQQKALDKFLEVSKMDGNSSGFNNHSEKLKNIERKSTQTICQKIHAQFSNQLTYTPNATFANNIVILGIAKKNPHCHFITTKIEHKSILNVFQYLETKGYEITYLKVDKNGNIDLKDLENNIRKNTKLISIQTLNSEIGVRQNLEAIGEIADKYKIPFHSDASQSFCKYNIDVQASHIDFLTISGYKIGAPKGIAALYTRDSSLLDPLFFGSGQCFSPGTLPSALIASFATAVENFTFDLTRIEYLFNFICQKLQEIQGVTINSKYPGFIVSFSISDIDLNLLNEEMADFSYSSGCSCNTTSRSNVIDAIDPDHNLPHTTLRLSFSDKTSEKDLENFVKKLNKSIEKIRKTSYEKCKLTPKNDLTKILLNLKYQ